MGIFQSKNTIYPDDDAYHHMIEIAANDIQKLITNIENTMETFYVKHKSVWYFTVQTTDNTKKKLVIPSTVFLKLFKRFCVREYITNMDGEKNTIIQFIHVGKSV